MSDVSLRLKVYGTLEELTVGLRNKSVISLPARAAKEAQKKEDKATVRVAGERLEDIPAAPERDDSVVIENTAITVASDKYSEDLRQEEYLYSELIKVDELTTDISNRDVRPAAASSELSDLVTNYNSNASSVGGTSLSSSPTTTEIDNGYTEITHRANAVVIDRQAAVDSLVSDIKDVRIHAELSSPSESPESLANSLASRIQNPANRAEALGAAGAVKIDLLKTLL